MSFRSKIFATLLVAASLLFVACGPTYVVQPTGQAVAYQPAYNPDQFVYDALVTAAIVNGVNGYYGPNHVFYPSAMVGGVSGYYVGGVFHTSQSNRTTVINNYQTEIRTHQASAPVNTGKPDYTTKNGGQGVIQRGAPSQPATPAPAAASPAAQTGKPSYVSQQNGGQGVIQRGAPTPPPAPAAPAKPQYVSQQNGGQGVIQRGAPAASAPPRAAPGTIGRSRR
jgi:hypothetical protein